MSIRGYFAVLRAAGAVFLVCTLSEYSSAQVEMFADKATGYQLIAESDMYCERIRQGAEEEVRAELLARFQSFEDQCYNQEEALNELNRQIKEAASPEDLREMDKLSARKAELELKLAELEVKLMELPQAVKTAGEAKQRKDDIWNNFLKPHQDLYFKLKEYLSELDYLKGTYSGILIEGQLSEEIQELKNKIEDVEARADALVRWAEDKYNMKYPHYDKDWFQSAEYQYQMAWIQTYLGGEDFKRVVEDYKEKQAKADELEGLKWEAEYLRSVELAQVQERLKQLKAQAGSGEDEDLARRISTMESALNSCREDMKYVSALMVMVSDKCVLANTQQINQAVSTQTVPKEKPVVQQPVKPEEEPVNPAILSGVRWKLEPGQPVINPANQPLKLIMAEGSQVDELTISSSGVTFTTRWGTRWDPGEYWDWEFNYTFDADIPEILYAGDKFSINISGSSGGAKRQYFVGFSAGVDTKDVNGGFEQKCLSAECVVNTGMDSSGTFVIGNDDATIELRVPEGAPDILKFAIYRGGWGHLLTYTWRKVIE